MAIHNRALKHKPYLTWLGGRARRMRKAPTPAEEKLWSQLLRYRPLGYKFTRQKPMRWYILDFYCSRLGLAIEVDGYYHRKDYDNQRDLDIYEVGIRTIRFSNDDVLRDFKLVECQLKRIIREMSQV
jgi:very-short-patch-repair endonuclease